ncbi:MAG TPA: SDR family oxidoreductase [Baekduia sp.]|nr:SDR family oxidoreductase [Baekduia sp.]
MALPAPSPDTVVAVTGASSGIGRELARELARRGHGLVLVARRRDRLEEQADELRRSAGVAVHVVPADLGDDTQRREAIAAIEALEPAVVGLCNNAGIGSFGLFQELEPDNEVAIVRLNVLALHEMTARLLPAMLRRGEGAILNLSSLASFQPLPRNVTYAATKAFVHSFSEGLATDLKGTGVSVTALAPGPVHTEFGEKAQVGEQEANLPEVMFVDKGVVARAAVDGMERGRRTVVPSLKWQAAGVGGRLAPRTVFLPAMRRIMGTQFR